MDEYKAIGINGPDLDIKKLKIIGMLVELGLFGNKTLFHSGIEGTDNRVWIIGPKL